MYTELRKLGLTKYETKIYQTLLEYSRLPVQEIAKHSGVPPTAVYPTVKKLLSLGLVQQFAGKVRTFSVAPPETALRMLIERKKSELSGVQQEVIAEAKKRFHQKEIVPRQEVLQLSLGRKASEALYKEFIGKARKSLYILGWRMYTIGDKYAWLRAYKKLIARKVDVRLLLTGQPEKQWELVDAYKKAGMRIRYVPLENFSLVVCDGRDCKITLKSKELPEKINLHLRDKDLAQAMQSYFLMTWEKAREVPL